MTKAETEAQIAVMQAFVRGEALERRYQGAVHAQWTTVDEPKWNWGDYEYRVKLELPIKYRLFLWQTSTVARTVVALVTREDQQREPRENWAGFIRWLGDWQEVQP